MEITLIGEIGVFLFNCIILLGLIWLDEKAKKDNISKGGKNYPNKKNTETYRIGSYVYFFGWIIVSSWAWYYPKMIYLGEFFAYSVVLPVILTSVIRQIYKNIN